MGSQAVAESPVAVVNVFRTVDAHADDDVVALEALTPGVINQRGIGLDVLFNHHPLALKIGRFPMDDGAGFVVKRSWQREGFSGVPENRKVGAPKRAFVHPLQQQGELLLEVEDVPLLPIWQIAVAAVEIAEGGRLDHQKTNGAVIGCVHQFANPPR